MERNSIIETIGSITKMENLQSDEYFIHDNILLLRNIDPFPGYHINEKEVNRTKPSSVFIILQHRYPPEKVNRINHELIKNRITSCYPSYGEIITIDSLLPCIRLKGLQDNSVIPVVLDYLVKHDLNLMPYQNIECRARIKIFKTFKIVEISDGIYRDIIDDTKFYIKIPQSLNWKRFEYIVKKIRYNLKNRNFDAAMGVIYRFCGTEDVIRIYDEDKSMERAQDFKRIFTREIKDEIHLYAPKLIHH